MPDLSAKPLTVPELEKLPYLNAVVQECKHYPFHSYTSQIAPAITCTLLNRSTLVYHRSIILHLSNNSPSSPRETHSSPTI